MVPGNFEKVKNAKFVIKLFNLGIIGPHEQLGKVSFSVPHFWKTTKMVLVIYELIKWTLFLIKLTKQTTLIPKPDPHPIQSIPPQPTNQIWPKPKS